MVNVRWWSIHELDTFTLSNRLLLIVLSNDQEVVLLAVFLFRSSFAEKASVYIHNTWTRPEKHVSQDKNIAVTSIQIDPESTIQKLILMHGSWYEILLFEDLNCTK